METTEEMLNFGFLYVPYKPGDEKKVIK
jgi:hypothetical protein